MGAYRVADTERGRVLIVGKQGDGVLRWMDCGDEVKRLGRME